jgi:hypothetical protein
MRYVAAVAVVLLAGCATQNQRHVGLHDVPSSTVFDLQDPAAGDATLNIVRDQGLWGAGCSSAIYVDDKIVADMEIGQQLVLHVPSGTRKLGVMPHGACSSDRVDVDASVQQGGTLNFTIPASGEGLSAQTATRS